MCQYLTPPRKGVYYFRRPIPERLRPIIGQREWFYSLKVKDREEAKRLIPFETIRTDQLLAAAEKTLAAAQPQSPAEVARQRAAAVQAAAQAHWEAENADYWDRRNDERDASEAETEAQDQQLMADRPEVAGLVDRAVAHADQRADRYKQQWLNMQAQLRDERARRRTESAWDSPDAEMPPPLPTQPISPSGAQRTPQGNLASVTVTGLFEKLVAAGRLSPAIAKEWQSGIDKFVAFIGHDDARRVTAQEVLRWRNHERDTPKANGEPRSAQRINAGYLGALRAAFKYGMEEMLIQHDPAAAVPKLRTAAKAVVRDRQFTKNEQKIILSAASKIDTGSGGKQALVRRWVPWICAYTGARVNEITQLRAEDVRQIDGQWIIHITPAAGRVKTKQFRNAPIHEHLLAQGFLAFVREQGDGPLFYDPDRGNDDSERGQFKKAGERLAAWVRSLGVSDPDIMPNHAWRHTFTSIAMECGMDERAADYIKGHASQGVSRKHYTHHTVKPLAEQLAKFPRYETD